MRQGTRHTTIDSLAFVTEATKNEAISPKAAASLTPDDHDRRKTFCIELQYLIEEDGFCDRLIFSDEKMFHLCGKLNRRLRNGKSQLLC